MVCYCGDASFYSEKMTELCRCAKEKDIPLEFNLLGYVNQRSYPFPPF